MTRKFLFGGKKLPLEEMYDGDLLIALSDWNEMLDDIARLCDRRIAYEDWPEEYRIFEELLVITESFKRRKQEVDA